MSPVGSTPTRFRHLFFLKADALSFHVGGSSDHYFLDARLRIATHGDGQRLGGLSFQGWDDTGTWQHYRATGLLKSRAWGTSKFAFYSRTRSPHRKVPGQGPSRMAPTSEFIVFRCLFAI